MPVDKPLPGFHRLHDTLVNFFYDYLPIPCSLHLSKDPFTSHAIAVLPRGVQASHFELRFGRRQQRWDYNARCLAQAAKTRKAVLGTHCGLQDLFIPILDKGKCVAWVLLGSFQAQLPSRDLLWAQWKSLRRGVDAAEPSDFLSYVQARLETPVLGAELRKSLIETFSEAGAALLGLSSPLAASEALNRLKTKRVSQQSPWRMWHYAETKRDRSNFDQGPIESHELAPWDAEEFGLTRPPDAALAFCLRDPGADAAEALVQTARLQMAVYELCRQRRGLVAGRSGAEAALILTAIDKRLQAADLARELQQRLAKQMGVALCCSWVSQPKQPSSLWSAVARAEVGLRLAAAQGLPLLEAPESLNAGPALDLLESLSQDLARAWAENRVEAARLARQKLTEAALKVSGGRLDLLRLNLRWSLAPLLWRLEQREAKGPSGSPWRQELETALAVTPSASALVQRFGALVETLGQRLLRPVQAERGLVMRQALHALDTRPEAGHGLAALARDLGLSSSRVSRLIKVGSGESFVQARTQARLAKAKRLLAESPLTLGAVSQECGWQAQAHFSRVFKQHEGLSPREFRKKNQIKSQN